MKKEEKLQEKELEIEYQTINDIKLSPARFYAFCPFQLLFFFLVFLLPFLLTVLFLFSDFFLFLFVTVSDEPLPLVKMVERLRTRYGRGIESRVSHAACTRGASRVTRVARAGGRERDCRWPRVGRARRFKLD